MPLEKDISLRISTISSRVFLTYATLYSRDTLLLVAVPAQASLGSWEEPAGPCHRSGDAGDPAFSETIVWIPKVSRWSSVIVSRLMPVSFRHTASCRSLSPAEKSCFSSSFTFNSKSCSGRLPKFWKEPVYGSGKQNIDSCVLPMGKLTI